MEKGFIRRAIHRGAFVQCSWDRSADLRGRLHLCPEAQVTTLLTLHLWSGTTQEPIAYFAVLSL